ncbi:MAG TPA: hypothetical protein PK359_04810 [Burkholderiaceae bacterium]|nr:hypothetical protein [Burkholderiaceae bacterium]
MSVLRASWTESLREPLTIGVGISLVLHAMVLLARFAPALVAQKCLTGASTPWAMPSALPRPG